MKHAWIAVGWIISTGLAFVAGTQVGVFQYHLADANNKAVILVGDLNRIESGKVDTLKSALNVRLDGELALHAQHLDSNLAWLFPLVSQNADRNLQFAAQYRKAHPHSSSERERRSDKSPTPFSEGSKLLDQRVARIVQQYGG